jgi:hypothetical protein
VILAVWIVALCLLGLWSMAGWGLHALLASGVQWAGELKPLIERIPLSAWMERWLPGWIDALHMAADLMQAMLAWLGSAAPVLVWVIWAIGTVMLLGLALLLTMVIALVRKNSPPPAAAA